MNIHSNLNSIAPLSQDASTARARGASTVSGNPAESAATPATPATLGNDETHLSQAAILASAASPVSDVRLDKVATIQQALANGSYAVSPSEVAGKLIDHLLQN